MPRRPSAPRRPAAGTARRVTARIAGGTAGAVGGLLVAGLAVWARRLVAARTMEDDHAAYWRRRGRSPGPRLLVALGDSLAQGQGSVHPERSWVGRLASEMERTGGTPVRVVNLGVCGATTAEVAREQLPRVPDAARRGEPGTLVALCTGTNDATSTDPEAYRRDLTTICAALPAGSLVADVPDFQRGPDRPAGARIARIAREVVAAHPGLRPVAVEAATGGLRPWELGPDLTHFSGIGYRRLGRAFAAALAAPAPG